MGPLSDHIIGDDNNSLKHKTSAHESWRQWEPDHEPSTADDQPDATTRLTSALPALDGRRPHSPAPGAPPALTPLNHHNQLTRFIAKQTLGYIPKLLVRSPERTAAPSSPAVFGGFAFDSPRAGTGTGESPTFRLPSLTPPLSPQKWTPTSSAAFAMTADDAPTPTDGGRASLPALRPSGGASTNTSLGPHRSDSFSETCVSPIPPLKRQHMHETAAPHSAMSIADLCQPFRYMRASSCPSDTNAHNATTTAAATSSSSPLPSPRVGVEHSWRPAIEAQAAAVANAIDARRGQRPSSPDDDGCHRLRLERSSSMDAPTLVRHLKRTAAESIDLTQWLDRPRVGSLSSLADSADSMHQLEQAGRSMHISDSPRSDAVAPYEAKREKKLCAFPQCASNAVTRGLCISHGGGRRCQRKDCTRGAQSKGLCVAHGGGRICRAAGCSNIQRSMGLCIRHGGGRRCSVKGCQKGVVRQDLCTAHGGKRKCRVADCTKHVKKKGLCRSHANSLYATSGSS